MNISTNNKKEPCYHCGDLCINQLESDGKSFCCEGCRQVYLLLSENNLCNYYNLDGSPGIKGKGKFVSERFAYLDDKSVLQKLIQFSSETITNITFSLPQMHCSSCVYLLENLHRIEEGIVVSRVNFQLKEVFISFNPLLISLRKVVELLALIGYEPAISLKDIEPSTSADNRKKKAPAYNKKQIYRIGIAGFCFANIMMLSFPEYLSHGDVELRLKQLFTWLNFGLSLPVLLYCASAFFISAWKGLRQKMINIDAPISLAIIATFARSYYEIISGNGAGYLDSGSGIVFFMLIGRWFQDKTYGSLSFDRDYLSYFPIGVTRIVSSSEIGKASKEENIPVTKLTKGDHIVIRNEEMIPVDAILIKGDANIDFSFVNGENATVQKNKGELIYAGGKQMGSAIELEVVKEVSQGYLTQLWNNDIFSKPKTKAEPFIHPRARYFTWVLFSIAAVTVIWWAIIDPSKILPAFTSVLIVACPCSLLLSGTFTNGNMLRIFGRNKLYLKNAGIIETLASIDNIVFDKTGTITQANRSIIKYSGTALDENEKALLKNMSDQSSHPLSKLIAGELNSYTLATPEIRQFREFTGQGISAMVKNIPVRIGSAIFIGEANEQLGTPVKGTQVHVEIDGKIKGHFNISNQYRTGIRKNIHQLNNDGYKLHVLSGDNDSERESLQYIFGEDAGLKFRQMPMDKLEYIQALQQENKKVLMIGDGLNDAGALMQADTGIAVNDNNAQFTPACDAILDGGALNKLSDFLKYARAGKKIITASFILSILYNIVGLSFAVSASLSPLVAAVLMPASSISIVLFVTIAGNTIAKKYGL
ncbi:MAG: heavy metal translocating P-type ATPase metal-binding domain-containing protein [Ferruginibacter sp.]